MGHLMRNYLEKYDPSRRDSADRRKKGGMGSLFVYRERYRPRIPESVYRTGKYTGNEVLGHCAPNNNHLLNPGNHV